MARRLSTGNGLGLSTSVTHRSRRIGAALRSALRSAVEALESRLFLSDTWFVAPNGSDSNPGTLAAPFLTIQHAADESSAGDTVFIRGGVYHETVTVKHSGTAGNPITFEAYNNESVTIDGADAITNWTASTGSVYTAPMSWDLGTGNNEVFVDGKAINEARWPNTSLDLSHPTLAKATSASYTATSATVYDAALTQPAGFWVGATMHIEGGQQWVMRGETVTASGPGWVTFTYDQSVLDEMPKAGSKFYLTGKPGALDTAGEWSLGAGGTLSLWTPTSDSPANHTVEVKAREDAFDLTDASYITIENVNVFAATIATSGSSHNVTIDHITAEYVSQFNATPSGWTQPDDAGISLDGAHDVLSNSVIAYSAGDGVYVGGGSSVVTNNVIHDVDYQAGESGGVRIEASNVTIDHNTIYNCGRSGIVDRWPSDRILYNVIHDFGLQTTDCGGIYTFGVNGRGAEFAYNTIYNGTTGGYGAAGVYLDNNSSGFVVDHNITYHVNSGLRMNMSSLNNTICNNTFDAIGNSVDKMWGVYDWTGTVVANNLFTRPVVLGSYAIITSNITATPSSFVDAKDGNYQLTPTSPAVGGGTRMSPFTNGYTATVPDVGALKYGQTPFANGASMSLLPADPSTQAVPPVLTLPPGGSSAAPTDATQSIDAMQFNAKQGNEAYSLGGLGYNFGGNWIEYDAINFGAGVTDVDFRFAVTNTYAGHTIALRLDSPTGPTIGTLTTSSSGSWSVYTAQSAAVSGASGLHNLYLVMMGTGPMGNIQSFVFS